MIFTGLLFLASQIPDVDSVVKRYQSFANAHTVFAVDVAISGAGTGKGQLILNRANPTAPLVDWRSTVNGAPFRFVTDGKTNIDIVPSGAIYDRLPATNGPYPGGQLVYPFGFPFPLVSGDVPFGHIKGVKVALKGAGVELQATQRATTGDMVITANFAPDGSLTRYSVARGSAGELHEEAETFTNYRFGTYVKTSPFDASPPPGYTPYEFDSSAEPLSSGAILPASLAKLSGVVVFLDDFVPDGLSASLTKLNETVPVTLVALKGSPLHVGRLPRLELDSAGFDAAGINVTPQFYWVRDGKVVQAWQGFRADAAAKFEREVQEAIRATGGASAPVR